MSMLPKKIFVSLGVFCCFFFLFRSATAQGFVPDEKVVLEFIRDFPNQSAIKLVRNDTVLALQNPDKMMPLASTMKIIIAIEYAKQAASGDLDPDELISLEEVAKYYLPNTDANAHPAWLQSVSGKTGGGSISIRELAKGMISHSSNANSEWLLDRLGIEKVNARIDSLGIQHHEDIFYFVSALLIGKEQFKDLNVDELLVSLKEMSISEYAEASAEIHEKLKSGATYQLELTDLGIDIQRVWSDNLPGSTVAEYVGLMRKINSKTYFSSETQTYLDEVMEFLMQNPANRAIFQHAGMKGGSSAFVLTKALYATDTDGNTTELAYFFDDLWPITNMRLQQNMNQFELKVLTDPSFRKLVGKELTE
ncbi:MAG: serine hydrolase [Bacteroidota bacterium]